MPLTRTEALETVKQGVEACRKGNWEAGLAVLATLAKDETFAEELPGFFYSYYGYGIARFEGRKREGLALCRHATQLEFYRGENYFNLARAYLLSDNRAAAIRAVKQGLAVDPKDKRLRRLYRELGIRRMPVVPFLPREHRLNILLGRLRHWFRR